MVWALRVDRAVFVALAACLAMVACAHSRPASPTPPASKKEPEAPAAVAVMLAPGAERASEKPTRSSSNGSVPRVELGSPKVSGRLPLESVARILRQNRGRLRLCYEDGLRSTPALHGRVLAKLVIEPDGTVGSALDAGSDLPNPEALACILRKLGEITFAQPQADRVTVVVPMVFDLAPPSANEAPER